MTHALKVWPDYFKAIESGVKVFELRKFDRPFNVGEKLLLQEWDPVSETYTGKEETRLITYVLSDADKFGLKKGYCIIGMKEIEY